MATGKALDGKPYAGNPHVRFDEGEVAPATTPRRGSLLYDKTVKPLNRGCAAALVAALACSASAAAYPTLTWTGLAGDREWMSPGNWTCDSGDPRPGETGNFVFIDVPDGTTITIGAEATINDLTVTNTAGAACLLTLTSKKNVRNLSAGTFDIYPNGTLDVNCSAPNPWVATYNGFNLRGGGALKFSASRESWGGRATVDASTFRLDDGGGTVAGMGTVPLSLSGSGARLELCRNAWVKRLQTEAGAVVDCGDFALRLYQTASLPFNAELRGSSAAQLQLYAPYDFKLATDAKMSGVYQVRNAAFHLGTDAGHARTIPSDATLDLFSNGIVYLYGDQTIGALQGEAATGAVEIPKGKTLTVAGPAAAASTYTARLAGMGTFVKDGAGYTLTMSGDSTAFTGRTTVAAGTLTLARPIRYDDDLVLYWPFDDGASPRTDRISNITLGQYEKTPLPTFGNGEGVYGDAARFAETKAMLAVSTVGWRRPIDGTNFTMSVWLKPSADDYNGEGRFGYFFNYGSWPQDSLAENLCLLRFYKKGATERIEGYRSNPTVDVSAAPLTDGQWHHIVYVHARHEITIWIDGVARGSWTSANDLYVPSDNSIQIGGKDRWDEKSAYRGDLDELIVANGLWDERRIKDEYSRMRAVNAAEALPTPAAKWTFDDGLVDEIGGVELESFGATAVAPVAAAGAYGKCINLANADCKLRLKEGAAYPFPTGSQAFTVSIRKRFTGAGEHTHVFNFGDVFTANKYFAVGHNGACRYDSLDWDRPKQKSCSLQLSDQPNVWVDTAVAWEHIVATYDGTTVRAYRNGRAVDKASAALDLAEEGAFYLGYYANQATGKTEAGAYVDDFRVWTNCCLTAEQVMTLARSLETDEVSGQFPKSVVTVASGAKLMAVGSGNAVQAVEGAGTLEVARDSSLAVGEGVFAGALAGNGRLTLTGAADYSAADASGFYGVVEVKDGAARLNASFTKGRVVLAGGTVTGVANEVVVGEGATVTLDAATPSAPAITTTGRLELPSALTIAFSGARPKGEIVVAQAGTLVVPADMSGWTLPDGFKARVWENRLRLLPEIGCMLILR